jgi:type IV pilus assembly protein PilZ
MTDLRRSSRVSLGRPVEFSTKGEDVPVRIDGSGRDLSLGGMFIETDLSSPVGERVLVYVTLPKAKREMALPAVVRWTSKDGMGVQFGLLGARETHEITEFVKATEGAA